MRDHRPFLVATAAAVALASAAAIAGAGDGARDRTAARVELGRRLFFDPAASRAGRLACADCHSPGHGFSDPRVRSEDEFRLSRRHSQGIADLSLLPAGTRLHWDGEFASVEDLLVARLGPLRETSVRSLASRLHASGLHASGLNDRSGAPVDPQVVSALARTAIASYGSPRQGPDAFPPVETRIAVEGLYRAAFLDAFGTEEATLPRVVDALAAYVASIRSARSSYDRHLAGEKDALPEAAVRGLRLFEGRAGCATCHVPEPRDGVAPLTDGKFHDTGIAERLRLSHPSQPIPIGGGDVDEGRRGITLRDSDRMRFRTPSLREVARRGPFMHDGSFRSLAEVVAYYDGGGTPHPGQDPDVKKLGLTEGERGDLVAFLECLSGEERAGLADPPTETAQETRVRIVDLEGRPLPWLGLGVSPDGDRFRGAPGRAAPDPVKTDAEGWARFPFPPATHVRLDASGFVIEGGRLVPDRAGLVTLTAVPESKFAVRALFGADLAPESLEVLPAAVPPHRQSGGKALVLGLVRRIGTGEAIFAGDAPGGDSGLLREAGVRGMSGSVFLIGRTADVDTSPGALNLLDLRTRPSDVVVTTAEGAALRVRHDASVDEIVAEARRALGEVAARKPADAGPERR